MTSFSSSSEDESFKKETETETKENEPTPTVTPLKNLSTEEAIHYLNLKYANRFSSDDVLFMEALERPTIDPPIVSDYSGKRVVHPRRHDFGHNQQYRDHNQQYRDHNNRDNRRYEDNGRGGGAGGGRNERSGGGESYHNRRY